MVSKSKNILKSSKACAKKSIGVDFHTFSPREVAHVRDKLLAWYSASNRDLPWRTLARQEQDPHRRTYLVWVSEVMLQQTQVATVIPYYNTWIQRWPTVQALSEAPLEEIHKTWAGLGYYSRATRLLEGAQKVVKDLNGHFPADLTKLPGVGHYTAAAVASIAMGQCCGVVDGNVTRVVTRLRGLGASTGLPATTDLLWKLADQLVSPDRPGDFNQALMELGAVVCTPKSPACTDCPLNSHCRAYHQSQRYQRSHQSTLSTPAILDVEDIVCKVEDCSLCLPKDILEAGRAEVTLYPRKPVKKAPRTEQVAVLILQHQDTDGTVNYLMGKRTSGLLSNLWEFPNSVLESSEASAEKVAQDLSPSPCSIVSIGEVLHVFSHIRTTYLVKHAKTTDLRTADGQRWMTEEHIVTGAVSTAMKKVFHLFQTHSNSKKIEEKKRLKRKNVSNQPQIKNFFKKKA